MIKPYIARAMMVSMLEEDQLRKVQVLEPFYPMANFNIQEMFGLPTIKERYGIPTDEEFQIMHNKRIEDEITRLNLKSIPWQESQLEWLHAFDWNVFNAKNNIVWDFMGIGKKGNLKEMLKTALLVIGITRLKLILGA